MDIWICQTCKEENEDYRQYCRNCGTWLLSTTHPAKKIQKSKPALITQKNNTSSKKSKGLKVFYIVEFVLILFFGLIIWIGSSAMEEIDSNVFSGFFGLSGLLLFGTSIFLTITLLLTRKLGKNKNSIRNHYFLAVGLIVISMFFTNTSNSPALKQVSNSIPTLQQYQSASLQLDYRDLTRNADSIYQGKMVHFKGKVYHLVNGKQDYVMVDTTDDSKVAYEEVFSVTRNDNSGNLLVGDIVDVYGIVRGTQKTTTFIGTESIVLSIESHYIVLLND